MGASAGGLVQRQLEGAAAQAQALRQLPLALLTGIDDRRREERRARVGLIGVPFDGYGRPGNQASASAVLREAGLLDAFAAHHVVDTETLDLRRRSRPEAVRHR